MSIVVDASVWVSASVPDDVHHAVTREWLEEVSTSESLLTPTLGLVETAGAVARRTGSASLARRVVAAIEGLPNMTVVIPDARLWQHALRSAASRSLRGADAVYVGMAELLGIPLATWDKEQMERAGRRVKTIRPSR